MKPIFDEMKHARDYLDLEEKEKRWRKSKLKKEKDEAKKRKKTNLESLVISFLLVKNLRRNTWFSYLLFL